MSDILLFNKPFRVMCQFSPVNDRATLADFIDIPDIYPAGRLDYDSEGLLLLTGNGQLQQRIAHPKFKLSKTYWVQVEGDIGPAALAQLANGVMLNDGPTRPATAVRIEPPASLWPRTPPVRFRAQIPTSWIALTINEGRNRQVRRMTAAVGHPTLRLIRASIGIWTLDDLAPGAFHWAPVPTDLQTPPPAKPRSSTGPKRPGNSSRRQPPHHRGKPGRHRS